MEQMHSSGQTSSLLSGGGQFGPSLTQLTNMSAHSTISSGMIEQQGYPMYSHAASMLPQMTMSHPAIHQMQEVGEVGWNDGVLIELYGTRT